MKINQLVIDGIRNNLILRTELMKHFECSEFTLLKMLRTNDPRLTQIEVLNIISKQLGLTFDEIFNA